MPPAIETKGLTKRFGTTTALADLTLDIEAGEVFGFLGPNGAGKTTTVRLLLGLLRPTSGSSRVVGLDAWADPVEVHRHVAYVPGEFAVWPTLTGAETMELLGSLHGDVDLAYQRELCERFDFDPSRKARSYSKGNRQKIALVAALSTRAPVLILDEPTAGLDPLKEVTFRDCVSEARARGQTVFLSSHILSEVEALCDRVGILRAGKLVDVGPLAQMRHLS
jgi:ABC-2 type transport system ATP-binding protein